MHGRRLTSSSSRGAAPSEVRMTAATQGAAPRASVANMLSSGATSCRAVLDAQSTCYHVIVTQPADARLPKNRCLCTCATRRYGVTAAHKLGSDIERQAAMQVL